MTELDSIVKIAEIILFVVLTVSAIYLIISLKKISKAADKMESTVARMEEKMDPVLQNAAVVSDNMKEITTSVRGQMAKVDSIVDQVKERADSVIDFERKAQRELETHVFDSLNFISAIVTGVKTFASRIKGSNGRPPRRIREYLEESSEDDF
jgi:uncharacterized protein YoxC